MEILTHLKYKRVRVIGVGQGKNSEVWLGDDPQLGGTLAVKEIPKALLQSQGITDYFAEAKAMFASEHPNHIVPIRYASESPSEDKICIAMSYFSRGSLQDRIEKESVPLREAVRIGIGILLGLQEIHSAGLLHYDLKPSNVLFSDRDDPMVADFGQTMMIDRKTGTAAAPRLYLSGIPPEIFTTGVGTVRSDVFQAGATLYRSVNSDPFFQAQVPSPLDIGPLRQAITSGKLPHRDSFMPHVPRSLKTTIRRALSLNPTDRFRSASDFASALENVAVKYDWHVHHKPNGELEWRGERDGAANQLAELLQDGGKWKTRVFTDGAKGRRANGKTSGLWKSGLTRKEALKHLAQYFHSLE